MLTKISQRVAARRGSAATLVGVLVIGFSQFADAFNMPSAGRGGEMCSYSLELQKSVEARRAYLVKLEQALGTAYGDNAVQGMYGNATPAAVQEDEEADGNGRVSVITLFKRLKKKPTAAPQLDSFSADCVACHNGVQASGIGVDLRDRPYGRKSQVVSFVSDHPIGMTYNSYAAGRKGFKRIPPGTKMVFVEGKVGCLTCHDPLNQERGRLVMSDRESALCLTCHDK